MTLRFVAVGRRLKAVVAFACGLFPLAGVRQRIDDGRLCQNLRDSVMGSPI